MRGSSTLAGPPTCQPEKALVSWSQLRLSASILQPTPEGAAHRLNNLKDSQEGDTTLRRSHKELPPRPLHPCEGAESPQALAASLWMPAEGRVHSIGKNWSTWPAASHRTEVH